MFINFESLSLTINLAIFGAAAVAIWFAGTRLSQLADKISDLTGLGKAFVGLIFLALATELPEVATTITAAISGSAILAVNNLFGGVVTQTVMLAVADLFLARNALTFFTPNAVLLLQGQMLIFLLGMAAGFMLIGELFTFMNVGLWSLLMLLAYIGSLFLSNRYEKTEEPWRATRLPEHIPVTGLGSDQDEQQNQTGQSESAENEQNDEKSSSLKSVALRFIGVSMVILVAGYILARSGEALASQTGLGASFIGASLLALSTSLPELSTTIGAVRLGNHSMAVSNIFGSNAIMIALLFLTDLFYREGAIFNTLQPSPVFAALMGMVVTAVYMIGLIERKNKTFLRMGVDSLIVIVLYVFTLLGLYHLRS